MRYSETKKIVSESTDFVRRRRHGSIGYVACIYAVLLALILGYMMSRDVLNTDLLLFTLVFMVMTSLSTHALYSIQRNLDLIMAVEFQNALFSSAINARVAFTLIVRRDGSAVYVDNGFRQIFRQVKTVDDRVIDYMIDTFQMDRGSVDRLFEALNHRKDEQFVVHVAGKLENTPYMLEITPLQRPHGFFMVQGREFALDRREEAVASLTE